jgi:hypothetical protein
MRWLRIALIGDAGNFATDICRAYEIEKDLCAADRSSENALE